MKSRPDQPERPEREVSVTRPLSQVVAPGQVLIQQWLRALLILAEDWEALPAAVREDLSRQTERARLLERLVELKLLTPYQAARMGAGATFGLVLGNYRILDRLGAGGMGVVYRAEHVLLRRPVALKVVTTAGDEASYFTSRFFTEMRAAAQLQHPNLVAATDAGPIPGQDSDEPLGYYYAMEYVPGKNLESLVVARGPLPVAEACDLIYQVAGALDVAHRHHLVHRDIKPSNVVVTPDGQAKLLDFGLARHQARRLTEPGTALGTVDYIAPEQARDASTVDGRADLYGLGGTLFWCLTARTPFPDRTNAFEALKVRLTQPPPSPRACRPDLPAALDAVVMRLMAVDRDQRLPTAEAVMRALQPFLQPAARDRAAPADRPAGAATDESAALKIHSVLLADGDADVRRLCRLALEAEGIVCDEVADGAEALEAVRAARYDVLLLDVDLPGAEASSRLRQFRERTASPHLKIVITANSAGADELAQLLAAGADDYLSKPFSLVQLPARIRSALRWKDGQDRSDRRHERLRAVNAELERNLAARQEDLVRTREGLILALVAAGEERTGETIEHVLRLRRYCRRLAEAAAGMPAFAEALDAPFVETLEACAPLHDLGMAGLPDHVLRNPGKLSPEDRLLMQAHTVLGATALEKVGRRHGSGPFLRMAVEVARHHHERWDGGGYPDRLAGNKIPLAARLVRLADVYDSLRCRRSHRPAFTHAAAVNLLTNASPGQFDPGLLQAFPSCAADFEQIFRDLPDGKRA